MVHGRRDSGPHGRWHPAAAGCSTSRGSCCNTTGSATSRRFGENRSWSRSFSRYFAWRKEYTGNIEPSSVRRGARVRSSVGPPSRRCCMCDRCIEWEGVKWHLYGDYYHTGRFPMRKLHVEMAEKHHGPRPAGHDVHHIDEDTTNNDPSNLEYVPHGEHRRRHATGKPQTERQKAIVRKVTGDRMRSREVKSCVCRTCGSGFTSQAYRPSPFCSVRCGEEWRRVPKFVPETRSCDVCGTEYIAKKSFQRYCSRLCNCKSKNRTFGKNVPGSYTRGKRRTLGDPA